MEKKNKDLNWGYPEVNNFKILYNSLVIVFIIGCMFFLADTIKNLNEKKGATEINIDALIVNEIKSTISNVNTKNDRLYELDYSKKNKDIEEYTIQKVLNYNIIKIVMADSHEKYDITTDENLKPIGYTDKLIYPNSSLKNKDELYLDLNIQLAQINSDTYDMLQKKLETLNEEAQIRNVKYSYKIVNLSDRKVLEYMI